MSLVGVLLSVLQANDDRSHERASYALKTLVAVRSVDSVQLRVAAGEPVDEVSAWFEATVVELESRLTMADGGAPNPGLEIEADTYVHAVRDMLAAISVDDIELADEINETRVGPAFEQVIQLATTVSEDAEASAQAGEETLRVLTWASLLSLAGGLAIMTTLALRSRDRQREELDRWESGRRIRSLVEGSRDVITLVAGQDAISVLSPTLGSLERFSSAPAGAFMSDLLPPEAFRLWRTADAELQSDGGHHEIEVILKATDGATGYFEGHGSLLVSDPTQRVWVWRDVTTRKELELELSHQAFHDSLTGAANRSLLHDRVEHALRLSDRSNKPVTVLICDLDDFKTINDSLGHSCGDELLKTVTRRICDSVRASDTVSRLGGDEFAVLLEDADTNTAVVLAERIIELVSHEVDLDDRKIFPSVSIGVATALAGTTTEELLRNADMAMYEAKRSGKGRSEVYQDQMHEVTSGVLQLGADLKTALAEQQFSLYFQPTVNLTDGTVEGFEALIRWDHPTKGRIPPDQFIHIAEATGMIIGIGRWVLQEACRAAVELQGQRSSPLYMSVNLSPHQLRDPATIDTVRQALEESGLQPEQLILEITEGSLLDNTTAVERLHELSDMGIPIAIDDFGTGYTSINYLQSLPVSILKIDRSFVSGDALEPDERQAFLNAIVSLAKSLNLKTMAEGIEEPRQLDELKKFGCDTGQGYFWSPATPQSEALTAVDRIEAQIVSTNHASLRPTPTIDG